MENHPIPQDITGFKFKLVGSITLKQFGYLLTAGILTTIVFILPFSLFVKIPLIMFFSLIAMGLAFVPIDGRPMDVMLINFAKTIPAENQYIYRKKGVSLSLFEYLQPPKSIVIQKQVAQTKTDSDYKRNLFLTQLKNSSYKPDSEELAFMNNIKTFFAETAVSTQVVEGSNDTPQTSLTSAQREKIKPIRVRTIREEDTQKAIAPAPVTPVTPLKSEDVQADETDLFQKQVLSAARQQNMPQESHPVSSSPNVRVINADTQLQAGFPTLPDVPNVILGIVKDPRGKVLPNIIVEVVDVNNTPVRAFKTNALGQFRAATPLPNGTYKIAFEDTIKRNEFHTVEVTLTGKIFQPVEVTSVDQRERLRQELFGGAQVKST